MKKRLFLGILPALLILSACNGGVQQIEDKNIFLEDTLAHEEIFGGEETGNRDLKPYRLNDDPVTHPDSDASIGVQFFIDDKGTVDEFDDMVSIRFVAAVTFNESNITPTNAVWTRTVSSPDGTTFPKDTGTYECEKAYKKLNSGGAVYTIEQFNGAQEPDTSYTHFVVYTLRNIPKVTYANYYVSAYLTLSDGLSQTTKAIAVSVDANEKYTYVPNLGTAFIDGTFSSTPRKISATSVRTNVDDTDKADFVGVKLSKNDTFVIKEFYNTKLYVKGASSLLKGQDNPIRHYFEPSTNLVNTIFDGGTYDLHFNKFDELWAENIKDVSHSTRYLYYSYQSGDEAWRPSQWWENNDCWTAMWIWGDGQTSKWVTFADDGDGFFKSTEPVNVSLYTGMSMVRLYYGANKTKVLNWDYKQQQTENDSLPSSSSNNDCVYICRNGDGQNVYTSWGTRTYL